MHTCGNVTTPSGSDHTYVNTHCYGVDYKNNNTLVLIHYMFTIYLVHSTGLLVISSAISCHCNYYA